MDTLLGVAPNYAEINWQGLDFSAAQFDTVTSIDKAAWQAELQLHDDLFTQLADKLPQELLATRAALEKRLNG
ncbi:phosphoenolpyruvate carboxykinase [compost metagenome]